jgi:hypothetical protein
MKKTQSFFRLTLLLVGILVSTYSWAQDAPAKPLSPPDSTSGKVGDATISVKYSSPSVKGRKVWGELVPYGKVWRAGANEATTFTTDKDIKVEGKALPAGTYSLFTIPMQDEWIIIFNKVPKQWGAFKYDEKQDALRVKVKPRKAPIMTERLVYDVTPQGLVLRWENLEVPVTIK